MRNIFVICALISVSSISIFAQNETKICPAIQIVSPFELVFPGETMTFFLKVENDAENPKLKYECTVSSGTIVEGGNTSTIKVATTPEMSGESITAKVAIQNFPANCISEVFGTAGIAKKAACGLGVEDYGKISSEEEKGRLDNLFTVLIYTPETIAFFRLSTAKNEAIAQAKKHIKEIIKHADYREFPRGRLIFAIEKVDEHRTAIQIIPENQEFPEYEKCEIIKGEDVK